MGKGSLIGRVVRGDWNGGFDLACGGHVVGIFVLVVGESELEGGGVTWELLELGQDCCRNDRYALVKSSLSCER